MTRPTLLFLLLSFSLMVSCSDAVKTPKKEAQTGVISTNFGTIKFHLHPETKNHKAAFIKLANEKHYDQFHFNRVIKDFVIQGGCPDLPEYFENSPHLLNPEFLPQYKHQYGAVGMGRDNNPEKQSNACQLYIVSNKSGLPRLDGDYMIFAQVFEGFDVLEQIQNLETDSLDQPLEHVDMRVWVE
ncbi:MAG: peptidylprolyl isomerase [Flavobacteriales bacterium]